MNSRLNLTARISGRYTKMAYARQVSWSVIPFIGVRLKKKKLLPCTKLLPPGKKSSTINNFYAGFP
jgi:hypothetical protein